MQRANFVITLSDEDISIKRYLLPRKKMDEKKIAPKKRSTCTYYQCKKPILATRRKKNSAENLLAIDINFARSFSWLNFPVFSILRENIVISSL